MNKHTPGPWVAEEGWNSTRPTITAKISQTQVIDYRGLVADLEKTAFTEQAQANAHLIAAAPVMYADLCAVRDYLFELYDEGNAKAGEYAASLGITIEQAEGRHHE